MSWEFHMQKLEGEMKWQKNGEDKQFKTSGFASETLFGTKQHVLLRTSTKNFVRSKACYIVSAFVFFLFSFYSLLVYPCDFENLKSNG